MEEGASLLQQRNILLSAAREESLVSKKEWGFFRPSKGEEFPKLTRMKNPYTVFPPKGLLQREGSPCNPGKGEAALQGEDAFL